METKIITVCGSTRYLDVIAVVCWLLERDENAMTFGLHSLPQWYPDCPPHHLAEHEGVADKLGKLHLAKIDRSDEIFIVDFDGYIGTSTLEQINHAKARGVPVRYFSEDPIGVKVREIGERSKKSPEGKTLYAFSVNDEERYHEDLFDALEAAEVQLEPGDFLRGCGDNCRLHSSSYRVTFGSTASDEELEDVDCFDPNIVASINCYLLEPSHDAIRDHVVVGDGPRLPEDCGPALLPVLARLPVQWKHETSAISDFQGYGHQRVMGWSAEIGVEEFVRLVEPLRPVNDDDLEEWLDQLALYLNPTVVKVICRKKTWTAIDHLKGDYQARAGKWASACFGEEAAINHFHRRSRFIEEAIELHQAAGGTADEIIQLVKHVYNKPTGDPHQEVGGTMVTLATLCNALGVDLLHAGEDELARVWEEFPRIRAKQAAAKEGSPLPGKVDV